MGRAYGRETSSDEMQAAWLRAAATVWVALAWGAASHGHEPTLQQPAPANAGAPAVVFEDVRVFDGTSERLSARAHVLVVDGRIQRISEAPIADPPDARVTRFACGGRTLMPGLIDAHVHIAFATLPQAALLTSTSDFVTVAAVRAAQDMLRRGFTSVRDLGGPVLGLKRGIDLGLVEGPRIWPSGAFLSQSGGHGDFRLPHELPAPPDAFSHAERIGAAIVADGPDEVRKRAGEQLALGASQLKLMAGGGVSSSYDPLDVTQYTLLFDPAGARRMGEKLALMTRRYTPAEALRMATSANAELLALSGPRNPYPVRLGVVEEGALADLLLVDGDPLADLTLLARPEEHLLVVMKAGRLVVNRLE